MNIDPAWLHQTEMLSYFLFHSPCRLLMPFLNVKLWEPVSGYKNVLICRPCDEFPLYTPNYLHCTHIGDWKMNISICLDSSFKVCLLLKRKVCFLSMYSITCFALSGCSINIWCWLSRQWWWYPEFLSSKSRPSGSWAIKQAPCQELEKTLQSFKKILILKYQTLSLQYLSFCLGCLALSNLGIQLFLIML